MTAQTLPVTTSFVRTVADITRREANGPVDQTALDQLAWHVGGPDRPVLQWRPQDRRDDGARGPVTRLPEDFGHSLIVRRAFQESGPVEIVGYVLVHPDHTARIVNASLDDPTLDAWFGWSPVPPERLWDPDFVRSAIPVVYGQGCHYMTHAWQYWWVG